MTLEELETIPESMGRRLHANHMELLGIGETMRLAHAYWRLKFARQDAWRRGLYRDQLAELLEENGPLGQPPIEMKDGWAIDTSGSLPHLDRVLADADKIIAEQSGKRQTTVGAYRSYFQDVWRPDEDPETYPAFLDFATSSDLLAVVSRYLQSIPALSTTLPSGIRFVESNAAFDSALSTALKSQ